MGIYRGCIGILKGVCRISTVWCLGMEEENGKHVLGKWYRV